MTDQAKEYLDKAIASFAGDPPDTQWLKGYLAALETVRSDLYGDPKKTARVLRPFEVRKH